MILQVLDKPMMWVLGRPGCSSGSEEDSKCQDAGHAYHRDPTQAAQLLYAAFVSFVQVVQK